MYYKVQGPVGFKFGRGFLFPFINKARVQFLQYQAVDILPVNVDLCLDVCLSILVYVCKLSCCVKFLLVEVLVVYL